jgi:hypothetical protein
MPTNTHTNRTAKPERMVHVLEQRARSRGAALCKVAESGARALVAAGLASWTNRGTTIRFCGDEALKTAEGDSLYASGIL